MKHKQKSKIGFEYYRTDEQIQAYRKVPAEIKLKWLDEMRHLSWLVAKGNPKIAKIQKMFRKG